MDDRVLLASVLSDIEATAALLESAPAASVAHCPGWTVKDLARHHGGVLSWAEAIVRTGQPVFEEHSAPDGPERLRDWYVDAAQRFIATVGELDRDRACWTFGRPPERVWFWIRRQALEATVHRWDAERAVGVEHRIRPDLAAVGITEVVDDLYPRQLELGRTQPLPAAFTLRADDIDQDWLIGSTSTDKGRGVVEASASSLLLLLWRRIDVDDRRVRFSTDETKHEWGLARFAP